MRIGEIAKIVGISSSAIRFYERHGLINTSNINRAENGYRNYSQKDLREIQLIVKFKEFGLELKEIKQLLSKEQNSCGDLVSSLDVQIDKCREMEKLILQRIELLTTAKESCVSNCRPRNNVRKCCA